MRICATMNEHTTQCHQADATKAAVAVGPSGGEVRMSLDNTTFKTHFGGANDGVMHFPLLGLALTANGHQGQFR